MTSWDFTRKNKAGRESGSETPTPQEKGWESVLYPEELAETFTDQVMQALEEVEIEGIVEAGDTAADGLREQGERNSKLLWRKRRRAARKGASMGVQVRRSLRAKRSSTMTVWGASVVFLLLAGSALLYTQPTLAEKMRSLFAPNSYIDNGMKQAREEGMLQISGASASDQGYTVKVNEVIADSTRMVIGVDITDANGNAVKGEVASQFNDFFILATHLGDIRTVPFKLSTGGNETTSRLEFNFLRPVLTDKLQLEGKITRLNLTTDDPANPVKFIDGSWNIRPFGVDLSKSIAQTLLTPIDLTYSSPSGMVIHMQGATRTPSGGSLEFTTELTPQAAARASDGPDRHQSLRYHLEDEQGNWIGENNTQFDFGYETYSLDRWSGLTHWFDTFNNFAYDKQKIRFVLDGYVIREKGRGTVNLDPRQVSAEHPVRYEEQGDRFVFKGFKLVPNAALPNKVRAVIPYEGKMWSTDRWVAVDESGTEYPMYGGGYSTDNKTGEIRPVENASFYIDGLDHMPESLVLKRTIVNRYYRDADWSFILPQTGMRGVIPGVEMSK